MATIKTRKNKDVTILDINGKLDIGMGASQLREAVRTALDEGASKLVLNLAETTTVDSSGIGEMVSAYTTTGHRGGKLKLLNPTHKLRDLMMITQLISIFEVFDNEDEVVASFA